MSLCVFHRENQKIFLTDILKNILFLDWCWVEILASWEDNYAEYWLEWDLRAFSLIVPHNPHPKPFPSLRLTVVSPRYRENNAAPSQSRWSARFVRSVLSSWFDWKNVLTGSLFCRISRGQNVRTYRARCQSKWRRMFVKTFPDRWDLSISQSRIQPHI